jgi:hypothetical protein
MDGTGLGLCPMAGFVFGGAGPLDYAIIDVVN